MDEKLKEILDQYSLEVSAVSRGRGAYICQTDQGLKIVREYTMSPQRLVFESMVKYIIRDRGYMFIDQLVANREGELYSKNKYDKNFVVKDWYDGRECDMRSDSDLTEAAANLARLHKTMVQVRVGGENCGDYFFGGMRELIEKHCREMKTIRNYMCKRKQINDFEKLYLENYDCFVSQGEAALGWLSESSVYTDLLAQAREEHILCHGDYHQHNVIFFKQGNKNAVAAVNFKMNVNIQINDLYLFLRKVMEKNQWQADLAMRITDAYDRVKPLSDGEKEYLYTLMMFPEKFWKIANHYYNTRKSWTSGRNQEKLETFIENSAYRERFLQDFKKRLLSKR